MTTTEKVDRDGRSQQPDGGAEGSETSLLTADGVDEASAYLSSEFADDSVIESFGPLARQHPAVLEKYIEMRRAAVNDLRVGGLDLRAKELVILAVTCMGRKTNPPPVLHVAKAMEAGATVQEIADVVALCIVVGGMITYQSTGRFILEAAEEYERQRSGEEPA